MNLLDDKKNICILTMPLELRKILIKGFIKASPYNTPEHGSFYNIEDKSWNYTPDKALRISDHWNFFSQGKKHSITDLPNKKIEHKWVLAEYNSEKNIWIVIKIYKKDHTAWKINNARRSIAVSPDIFSITDKKKRKKLCKKFLNPDRKYYNQLITTLRGECKFIIKSKNYGI